MSPKPIQTRAPLTSRPMPGNERQQEQHDRDEPGEVGVAEQHAVVADDEDGRDRGDDRDRAPHDLAHRGALPAGVAVGDVDAVDHGDAEPVEHGRDRQQERVGVARDEAHRDVQPEDERREAGAEQHELRVDAAAAHRAARARWQRR